MPTFSSLFGRLFALALLVPLANDCEVQDPPVTDPTQVLVYGQKYHLQNGYAGWTGGYLDTRGQGCEGNFYCVSTASSPTGPTIRAPGRSCRRTVSRRGLRCSPAIAFSL